MSYHQSAPASLDQHSLQRSTAPVHSMPRQRMPRTVFAATYSTYVVRVHTRHGIKTISFDVLAAFFTYTAKKAAEDLGISSRTLIRVCRSLGIRRWPYLGFRSEKNVERIRQEAIDNLRRKLERESSEASSAASSTSSSAPSSAHHHASASCLRGASAKRLLQVKPPSQAAVPTMRGFERPSVLSHHVSAQPSGHFVSTMVDQSNDYPHHHMQQPPLSHHHQHHLSPMSLLTPLPTYNTFHLDRQPSVSPRRQPFAHATVTSFRKLRLPMDSTYGHHRKTSSASVMPSLNVLMEASVLTTFKHEDENHLVCSGEASPSFEIDAQLQARTMSMRDILSNSAMTA